ncbi:hypothetical protein [[Eubacterium] cellulosolvens]
MSEDAIKFDYMGFKNAGKQNTDRCLEVAKKNADMLGVKTIVIASTTGFTAKLACEKYFPPREYKVIIVTHNAYFKEGLAHEMPEGQRKDLISNGAIVVTGTLAFSGVQSSLEKTHGHWEFSNLFAKTIRTIMWDGVKVCMEIVMMAADAGEIDLVNEKEVISIAGTGQGADTCCLITPNTTRRFLDLRLKAILCKPL